LNVKMLLCALMVIFVVMLAAEMCVCPVKAATGLSILPTDSGFLNDAHLYYIVGEVYNSGNITETDVKVAATFYASNGTVLAESQPQPTKLLYILPNRTSPFDITLYDPFASQQVHNYTLHITTFSPSPDMPIGLEITSNNSSLDSNGFHLYGAIRNIGTENASYPTIIATYYAANGHVISTTSNHTNPITLLETNQTTPFNLLLNASTANQVDHYVLQAESSVENESYYYELVPEFQPMTLILAFLAVGAITAQVIHIRKERSQNKV